ncbi:hypothetical protein NXX02_13030 [Bacteroides fragilis]|nr:hypothetical protein [Bacteroides fragilis]
MIEYMNIPALVCVSLLGAGALAMIVGSLLKKQWATEGKKDFVIHLPFIPFRNGRFRLDMV